MQSTRSDFLIQESSPNEQDAYEMSLLNTTSLDLKHSGSTQKIFDILHNEKDKAENRILHSKIWQKIRDKQMILYVPPVIDAMKQMANISVDLYTAGIKQPHTIALTCAAEFLCALGLNGDAVRDTVNEVFDLGQKGLPQYWQENSTRKNEMLQEWPTLTPRSELIARLIATPPIFWAIFTDSVDAVYFIKALPQQFKTLQALPNGGWYCLAGIGMLGAGITSALTKGSETYKGIRKLSLLNQVMRQWDRNKIISVGVGVTLSVFDAIDESINSYAVTKALFGIERSIPFSVFNFFTSPLTVFFSGIVTTYGLKDFLDYIPNIKNESHNILLKNIFTFAFSLTIATYLAAQRRNPNEIIYDTVSDDGFDPLMLFISYMIFIQEAVLGTISLYNPVYKLLTFSLNQYYNFLDYLINPYHGLVPNEEEISSLTSPQDDAVIEIDDETTLHKLSDDHAMNAFSEQLKKYFNDKIISEEVAITSSPTDTHAQKDKISSPLSTPISYSTTCIPLFASSPNSQDVLNSRYAKRIVEGKNFKP